MPGDTPNLRLGADMGGNDIKFGATNLDAREVLLPDLVKRPSLAAQGPQTTLGQMVSGLEAVLGRLEAGWDNVADISITVPCPCSPGGTIIEATNLGTAETKQTWQVPFGEHLAAAVQEIAGRVIPVFACNDANAAGQDDDFVRYQGEVGPRTNVFVTTGTGLGGCVLIDGSVYFGLGQAGELGHVKPAIPAHYAARFAADPNPICGCGGHQCVETRASLQGLVRRIQWALSPAGIAVIEAQIDEAGGAVRPETVDLLKALCQESPQRAAYEVRTLADRDQDAFCRWLLEDWAIMIGALFASLTTALHPNHFIVGGGLSEMSPPARDWFLGVIRTVYAEVNQQACFASRPDHCEIVWSASEDQGWRGAILMSMRAVR